MAREFKDILLEHIKFYFDPILRLRSQEEIINFFQISGWKIDEILGSSNSDFYNHIETIIEAVELIIQTIDNPDNATENIELYIDTLSDLIIAIQELPNSTPTVNFDNADDLPGDIFNTLLSIYLYKYQPAPAAVLELLTILVPIPEEIINSSDVIIKQEVIFPMIQWDVIPDLFSNPVDRFSDFYWPNGFDTIDHVNDASRLLFHPLSHLFEALGFVTMIGKTSDENDFSADINKRMDGFLSVAKRFSFAESVDESMLGLTMGLIPTGEGGPGMLFIPFGKTTISQIIEYWLIQLELSTAIGGIQITGNGVSIFENPSQDAFGTEIILAKLPDESGQAVKIGSDESSHFSIQYIALKTEIAANSESAIYGVYLVLEKAKLVIKGGDGDGFLSEILGEGFTAEFSLEVGYSNHSGFHFKGSGGLEIVLPSHISLGPIDINNLTLGIGIEDGLNLKSHATIKLELGPFVAVVEGLGIKTNLSFPEEGGNLGPANLDFGFKPPTGIGLSLDASVVKGGGYLFFDAEKEQYGGALEIVIAEKISVVAIALITTRFPDGSKGFSLLLLISVEFSPGIALGMGFFLSGIGGMIGINRTMNTDALRTGVKQGSVDHIMFPTDVVANIQRIITDLREFFPPQRDQFIIGLLAKITWGVPTLLSVEFGIAIEFSNPVRLAILGVIKLVLPTEEASILKIQVNFLGVIDFNEGYIMFDASLFGSKILTFTLEGDMALRIFWGKEKEFLLSVGGFHPAYSPPAFLKVSNMARLTLNILSGNPSLTLTTYFAITSNTVQFGASIDFLFKVSKFKAIGYFGFDVLFQFSPFRFMASIRAGIEIKLGSTTLFAIHLAFNLEGPTPWVANGTASFKILFFKVKVKFSTTWGERREDILPGIAVLPKLIEGLEQPRNWIGDLPVNKFLLTSMKNIELLEGQVIMHAVGTLTIRQTIMPLGMEIAKFGNYAPIDIKSAFISSIKINGVESSFEDVKDAFAPAEFKDMEDDDKLKAPSYKDEVSGIKITATENLNLNYGINRKVEYELRVSDYHRESDQPYALYMPLKKIPSPDKSTLFKKMALGGAIAKNELSKELKAKSFSNENAVNLQPEKFVVSNMTDLTKIDLDGFQTGTKAEADDLLKKAIKNNPSLKNKIQVIPEYELMEI